MIGIVQKIMECLRYVWNDAPAYAALVCFVALVAVGLLIKAIIKGLIKLIRK